MGNRFVSKKKWGIEDERMDGWLGDLQGRNNIHGGNDQG